MGTRLDPHSLQVAVHDLKNVANVMNLTLLLIAQTPRPANPDLDEDLSSIQRSYDQIHQLLCFLGDYCKVVDQSYRPAVGPFDPRRMLAEVAEQPEPDSWGNVAKVASPVVVEVREGSPVEVELDQRNARMAVQYAVVNASASADGTPVRLVSAGDEGRWVVEVRVDRPPGEKVESFTLREDAFEHIQGGAEERRGLDLTIVAAISERLGGTARLDARKGECSSIIMEWPTRT